MRAGRTSGTSRPRRADRTGGTSRPRRAGRTRDTGRARWTSGPNVARRARGAELSMVPGREVQAQQARPGISLLQADDPRQGSSTPGARAGAPDQLDPVQAFDRNSGPDDPASKGIVERGTLEKHQGPTGAGGRNPAKG